MLAALKLHRTAHSLVTRLVLFGLLLVILGAVARYFLLSRFLSEDLQRVVSAQQIALAEAVASDVDYKVEERRRFLQQLALAMPQELLQQPARLRDWLAERHRLQPLFNLGLVVADLGGTVLADYPPVAGRVGISIAENPGFIAARGGRAGVGSLIGPLTKQPVLPMGTPVKDRAGQVRAVLIGATALAAPGFLDRLQQGRIGQSGGFLLISPRDKLFVAASDASLLFKPTPSAGTNLLHDRAMAGFRGSGVTVNAKGVEEISAMVSVPSTGWFVVARLPTAEAFATVGRAQGYVIRHSFTAMALVFLVGGSMIAWLLRPLYRAADLADRMTLGEIPLKPLPVVRDDEVGHLTAAFNRLLSKLASSQAELERMAHHDELTGLPNRSLLADRMQQALARAKRNGTRLAVLFLDLDGFKQINDTQGHEVGDKVLQVVAQRLQAIVRQADTLARVGGDEFVLLAVDLEDSAEAGARALASKCIDTVAEPVNTQNVVCTLGVSIGVTLCGGDCDAESLLVAADKAMYAAKQKGRGCYVVAPYCEELRAIAATRA